MACKMLFGVPYRDQPGINFVQGVLGSAVIALVFIAGGVCFGAQTQRPDITDGESPG